MHHGDDGVILAKIDEMWMTSIGWHFKIRRFKTSKTLFKNSNFTPPTLLQLRVIRQAHLPQSDDHADQVRVQVGAGQGLGLSPRPSLGVCKSAQWCHSAVSSKEGVCLVGNRMCICQWLSMLSCLALLYDRIPLHALSSHTLTKLNSTTVGITAWVR